MRFRDKVCVVTGGASGIGAATCARMAAEGGEVAIVDIAEAAATRTAGELAARGSAVVFQRCDVSRRSEVRACIDAVIARFGAIDVLVNNAAVMSFAPVTRLEEREWDRVIGINLTAAFLFCKYGIPHLRSGGAIVNVSSVHAHETTRNVAAYAASKGGLEAFTRALSIELRGSGVRVNCVAPGAVDTPMLWSNPNIASGVEPAPKEIGRPEDVAAVICFLAAAESAFVNGATLVADGGHLDRL
jgi:NAD(P)-dependent dehydrogenase (short-subunit alcohol dehydrogenase family)